MHADGTLPQTTITGVVKEYQRKQLLERISRDGATIGHQIPSEVNIQDKQIDLNETIFEFKRHDTYPTELREQITEFQKQLRRERVRRRDIIEEGDISYAVGESHAAVILGIDRALNALSNLDPTDLESEVVDSRAADRKRWISFLRDVLDSDTDRGKLRN